MEALDIQSALQYIFSNMKNTHSTSNKIGHIEQTGGFPTMIALVLKEVLRLVFEHILLPLAEMLFHPPSFFKERPKTDDEGNLINVSKNVKIHIGIIQLKMPPEGR